MQKLRDTRENGETFTIKVVNKKGKTVKIQLF